jgi:ATP-dependent DNA ligase
MPSKLPPPQWIPPQLTQLVETAPSGRQWLHEIKLDGFRMAAAWISAATERIPVVFRKSFGAVAHAKADRSDRQSHEPP